MNNLLTIIISTNIRGLHYLSNQKVDFHYDEI